MDRNILPLTGLFTIPNSNRLEMENNTEIMEIILLGDEPVKVSTQFTEENNKKDTSVQIVELSDRNSKMAMLRQLKLDSSLSENRIGYENCQTINATNLQKNMEIFTKLPPGTVLIRQDNEYNPQQNVENQRKPLKEMAETTSSGSTSSGAPSENPKRIQRPIRNKKTVEVRRNPTRVSKKNLDKDFVNPRQRLLSAKRRENFINLEPSKRIKISSTPYMNTRSVTRKLYTVGSIYQPPTIHDAMEWKEWPVHGMHERPVFHPRLGLGVENIGKFFKSLNNRSYVEIQEESEVEVISVDPRDQIADSLNLNKLNRKTRKIHFQTNGEISGNVNSSFETIMHTSLHLVLAYGAKISSPIHEKIIQGKINKLKTKSCNDENNQNLIKTLNLENNFESGNLADKIINFQKSDSVKMKNTIFINNELEENESSLIKKNNSKISNLMTTRMESTKCLITPRNSSNSMINSQNNHSILQDAIRGSSKNALILIKAQEKEREKFTTSELNYELTKLEESAISDETLMEMSSIYEKFVPIEDINSNPENLSKSWEVEGIDSKLKNCDEHLEVIDNTRNKNQTSEIAKILSEYIQSINKVPGTKNCSSQIGVKNSRNESNFNDQRKWTVENKNFRKSPASIEEQIMEINEEQNKIEIVEVLDLSTMKSKEDNINQENEDSTNFDSLQNLLENTAILYCAATGVHQSNLADYINTLDAKQSLGWLKAHNT